MGPKKELIKKEIELKDLNLLVNYNELKSDKIFVKVRSTGKLLSANIDFIDDKAKVNLLEDEYGISPGQACVFYAKDEYGDKVLGGGWIQKTFNKNLST